MNRYASSSQLKDKAKEQLTGHYGLLIGIILVTGLISITINSILDIFVPMSAGTISYILSVAVTFLVSVFMGVFNAGTALVYLKFASGGTASLSDIFYGFTHHIENTLTVSLVMIPCLAAAMVIYVPLSLGLSQCYYLMLDFPDKPAAEILKASFRIMRGQKGRLFYMELSFLPLLLLGAVSLVGILWVIPYMQMTFAAFYFDIMKQEQR